MQTSANPDVRSAFTNFAMYILRTYHPAYLGLGSEVNTYANAYPEDYPNYLSLYQDVYDQIKAESPETQVFCQLPVGRDEQPVRDPSPRQTPL